MSGIPSEAVAAAARANADCVCVTLDRTTLIHLLDLQSGVEGLGARLSETHPYLFAETPVFLNETAVAEMESSIGAIEAAVALPQYRAAMLSWAEPAALHDFGPAGAMMGYDFHLTDNGPRLIEINTNAGGAFLNAVLAKAQRACCAGALPLEETFSHDSRFDDRVASMFRSEWARQGRTAPLKTIAIVDDAPQDQYLFPEFLLAKASLEKHGLEAFIADPREFAQNTKGLSIGDRPIDLIYNRLVDFTLDEPRNHLLRSAYLEDHVVVTPNPHVHAKFADKRNLTLLSDPPLLTKWGLPDAEVAVLCKVVPHTVQVTTQNSDSLWADRRNLFFKPARGYASKAAYNGAKLTRRVWGEITAGDYIAQAYVAPGKRAVLRDGVPVELKVDVRLYTYEGKVLIMAARLYHGQTTNMRTPGGGFAPVLELANHR